MDPAVNALADLWGPIPIDPEDPYYCQCTVSSNNTGELLGMWNALQWAKRQGGDETFAIVFDSIQTPVNSKAP